MPRTRPPSREEKDALAAAGPPTDWFCRKSPGSAVSVFSTMSLIATALRSEHPLGKHPLDARSSAAPRPSSRKLTQLAANPGGTAKPGEVGGQFQVQRGDAGQPRAQPATHTAGEWSPLCIRGRGPGHTRSSPLCSQECRRPHASRLQCLNYHARHQSCRVQGHLLATSPGVLSPPQRPEHRLSTMTASHHVSSPQNPERHPVPPPSPGP